MRVSGSPLMTTAAFSVLAQRAYRALKLAEAHLEGDQALLELTAKTYCASTLQLFCGYEGCSVEEKLFCLNKVVIVSLSEIVSGHLARVTPWMALCVLRRPPYRKLEPCWRVPDLLSAMWFQFYWFLTQNKSLNRCVECGSLFVPTRKNQKFCPPFPGQRQSSCANRYYVRRHREKTGRKFAGENAVRSGGTSNSGRQPLPGGFAPAICRGGRQKYPHRRRINRIKTAP